MKAVSDDFASATSRAQISVATGGAISPTLPKQIIILAALFALAVLLQVLSGAFTSEFNAYPDEPAHYVTSLMLREYITSPHPIAPLKFAEQYYHHYPKVAFGHWPPLFYLVQAFWMLLFSASRASVRLEVAFTTALVAFTVWREFRVWFGQAAALLAASLLICLPLVQNSTDEEMAETLLVLCCFWSTIYFGRYLESGKRSDALWFALYFALAVLTKGSGWLLAFVPPIALVLTRKLRYLFASSFWYGILLIAVLCLPWQLVTLHSAERGWAGSQPSVGYTATALVQFTGLLVSILGPILFVLAIVGLTTRVIIPYFQKAVESVPAVMFALVVGDWLFHALVPAGVEDRKLIIAVPALVYFLFAGGCWLADALPFAPGFARWRRPAVALVGAIVFFLARFTLPRNDHYGYAEAASYIASDPAMNSATLLVSSGSIGEGLLVSEVAMQEPRPRKVILRSTKELAQMDWTGRKYRSLITSPDEFLKYLDKNGVNGIVLDTYAGQYPFPHQKLVDGTIHQAPEHFRLLATFPGRVGARPGKVEIYQVLR